MLLLFVAGCVVFAVVYYLIWPVYRRWLLHNPPGPSKLYRSFMDSARSQKGKVFVVTGCTSGTGLVFAKSAAKLGAARVVMLNRESERAKRALKEVESVASGGHVVMIPCDLSSFESIRHAAKRCLDVCGKDGIGNGAGKKY